MTPTFTVLIGACAYDRPDRYATLKHTLDSIARQDRQPGDQVIVCVDAFEQPIERVASRCSLVQSYGVGFMAAGYDAGYHFFGVEQINFVIRANQDAVSRDQDSLFTGSHIMTFGDDDVLVDNAYATLRPICAQRPETPILYRFLSPWREVLWDQPRMEMSRISGCCIAAPRQFVGPMNTQTHWPGEPHRPFVEHDYFWMQDILKASGKEPLWLKDILVIARPDQRGDDVAHQGVLQCWACGAIRYYEDMVDQCCPQCHAMTYWRPKEAVTR